MKAEEILYEARGVTARAPGETYVNDIDSDDVLTFQKIYTLPSEGDAYADVEELEAAIDELVPNGVERIDDNAKNAGMRAALVAHVTDSNGKDQMWVRYIKSIPAGGIHGMWKTLRGYKFSKGAKQESIPIKPSDLITDENFRNTDQLSTEVIAGINKQVANTEHAALADIMENAVTQARRGTHEPIPDAMEYIHVLQKYGGEYLGVLALIDGIVAGDTSKMLQAFGLNNLRGSTVMFPQDTAMELIDSVVRTPDGQDIQISSKISKAGGAASSMSGIVKQLTDDMRERFPVGTQIIETLGTESAVNGPLKVARMFKIIDDADIQALDALDRGSQNIADLQSERLRQLTQAQGVQDGTLERSDYRVFFHTLTAIVNAMIPAVNANEEFKAATMAALNNNNYVQILTRGGKRGNDVVLDYYSKFPAVFKGAPQLYNKVYFATGQKGRIGFKLK
jgi:hypothetical protein